MAKDYSRLDISEVPTEKHWHYFIKADRAGVRYRTSQVDICITISKKFKTFKEIVTEIRARLEADRKTQDFLCGHRGRTA